MIDVDIKISIQFRSDGNVDRGAVLAVVQDIIRDSMGRHEQLQDVGATYAGYTVSMEPKKK